MTATQGQNLSHCFAPYFSAYIACLSSLGILKRNGVKNSATSHPSCRLLPRHLFLTELNWKTLFFYFLFRFFSFYFSACSVWCLLFCDILLLFWMPDKRVVNSNLKRSTSRCLLSATGKPFKQTESESLGHFLAWPNLMYFPTCCLMCLLTPFVVRTDTRFCSPMWCAFSLFLSSEICTECRWRFPR